MMDYRYLAPFEQEEFMFSGAHCFSVEDRCYLLAHNGSSIVLHGELVNSIARQQPSEDLAFKLYQRGFGTVYGAERFPKADEQIRPTLFMIDFTTKCNCNCIYCLRHFEDVGDSISPQMLKRITGYIIDYCRTYNIRRIAFQPWGGEPLLELDQILECKRMIRDAGIRASFNIQTNGLLLNLKNYEKLREAGIDIGVSLDGIADVHDAHRLDVRGNTTHAKIIRNLQEIFEKYPDANVGTLSVNSVFSRNHIRQNVDYLVRELGLQSIKFNLVHPSGADTFDASMLITEEQLGDYVDALLDAVISQIRNGRACREANIADKLSNLLNRTNGNICNSRGCRGGMSFISFDQQGNIYPCEMIGRPEFCLGNIADEQNDLIELISSAQGQNEYYTPREIDTCGDCPYLYFCRGGCKASCLAYGQKPCQIDRIECALNRRLYPRLIELILTDPVLVEKMMDHQIWMG